MKLKILIPVLLVTVFTALAVFGQADERYPEPQGYVSDFAGVISPSHQQQLENILREIKQKTGVELALVTMDSIPEGQDISLYAVELGHHWGVGSRDTDKGALLLYKNGEEGDRDVYLATGYGLEGDINDAKAGRILDEVTIPLIKHQNYTLADAFAATAVRIAQTVDPDVQLSGVPQRQSRRVQQENDGPGIIGLIFMFILILVLSRSRLGRGMLFGMLLGGLFGGHRGHWGGGGGFGGGGFGGGFGGFGGGGFGGGGAGRGGF